MHMGRQVIEQEEQVEKSLDAIEAGIYRTLGYSLIWWYLAVYPCTNGYFQDPDHHHCQEYNGSDGLRVLFVMSHVLWTWMCEWDMATGHPFVDVIRWMQREILEHPFIIRWLSLGPKGTISSVDEEDDEEDDEEEEDEMESKPYKRD